MALARLRHDLELGVVVQRSSKRPQPPCGTAAPKKVEVGTYLGLLLRQPRAGIPTVACALLSQQEAAEAAARGVAVAYARVRAYGLRMACAHLHSRLAYACLGGARPPSIVP